MSATTTASAPDLYEKWYACTGDEDRKKFIKDHEGALGMANRAHRKLGRVGLPWSTKADQRTDEIPVIAGVKNFLKYVPGAAVTGFGAYKFIRWVF